ncbi:hypothetical protein CB0940_05739 [Cercospora beticola]|uniref:Uncharacterized protein n=1 Tax=Cercospora beticola TaxID=122368 RepID=A0A2G5HX33_CERBT|nr:hypothetical protein CB0940_05739 [Cercospora beticola]PIA97071.1 hypothetical protein CB0940_05739 [Cercospora beticola]WPA98319.1 hypothetical protein RHO25_002931 [Cercospora beticola]
MPPSNKRGRIERVERNAAFLRHIEPNFKANELELLDDLFDDATLPSAASSKKMTERWRIRLEDLLHKAGENMGLAQELVAKVVKERTGNSTYEVIPDDLYNVHDQFSYAEGKRDTLDNLEGVPEVQDWAARMHADAVEEPEDDDSNPCDGGSDSISDVESAGETGPAQASDQDVGGPGHAGQRNDVADGEDDQMQTTLSHFSNTSHPLSSPSSYASPQSKPGRQAYEPGTPSVARIWSPTAPGGYEDVAIEAHHEGGTTTFWAKMSPIGILHRQIASTSTTSDRHRNLGKRKR